MDRASLWALRTPTPESFAEERLAGEDVTPGGEELHHWWTKGPGLALWASSPHPWRTLKAQLKAVLRKNSRTVPDEQINRWVSSWVHEVTGMWSGEDKYRVAHGGKPRGKRIGPG